MKARLNSEIESGDVPFDCDGNALPESIDGAPISTLWWNSIQPDYLSDMEYNLIISYNEHIYLVKSIDFEFEDTKVELTEDVLGSVLQCQQRWIKHRFGKRYAANYGWVLDDYTVTTKIYGKGYLQSYYRSGGSVSHRFEPLSMSADKIEITKEFNKLVLT